MTIRRLLAYLIEHHCVSYAEFPDIIPKGKSADTAPAACNLRPALNLEVSLLSMYSIQNSDRKTRVNCAF